MRICMNFDLPNCLSTQILYMKVVMSVGYEIQPAVITTFALSDLMALTQKCHAPPAVAESFCLYFIK